MFQRFAVADGATDTIYAGLWASLLTKHFVSSKIDLFATGIEAGYAERINMITAEARDELQFSMPKKDRPWNEEYFYQLKLAAGSASTLLGIEFRSTDQKLGVVAVGDTCLFLVRNGEISTSFPIQDLNDFGDRPDLVISKSDLKEDEIKSVDIPIQNNDLVVMATDSVSKWIMRTSKDKPRLVEDLVAKSQGGELRDLLNEKMEEGELDPDDQTILVLRVEPTKQSAYGFKDLWINPLP